MTEEQFWYGNPKDFFIYMEAYQFKKEEDDTFNYMKGQYTLLAFAQIMCDTFGKTRKDIFPKKPFLAQQKDNSMCLEDKIKKMLLRR